MDGVDLPGRGSGGGMQTVNLVMRNRYQDSVTLMQVAVRLRELEGIEDASLMMGTEPNREMLAEAGLLTSTGEAAGPNDLIVTLRGTSEAIEEAQANLEALMRAEIPVASGEQAEQARVIPHSLSGGLAQLSGANLVLISTPGIYAASEAHKALARGKHVMIFSDNVAVEDEIRLKNMAHERGLLLMGPDCGTAIIGGVPLGFANAVRRGSVGVVGASGTGMQEITTLVDRFGSGISHAIGTGSRDLSAAVGGMSTLAGLAALQNDHPTQVIVVVSKPPDKAVAQRVLEAAGRGGKPTILAFLGMEPVDTGHPYVRMVDRLDAAAMSASILSKGPGQTPLRDLDVLTVPQTVPSTEQIRGSGSLDIGGFPPVGSITGKYVRGLFSGGTFCYEAMLILRKSLGPVYSNTPLSPELKLTVRNPHTPIRDCHACLDLGADEFTVGRPHPMIDMSTRRGRLLMEAEDPEVAVILLDLVLGYGAHPDPAGALVPAIEEARNRAAEQGRRLHFVASITGTEADPQVFSRQRDLLRKAGVFIGMSNADAAGLAASIVKREPLVQQAASTMEFLQTLAAPRHPGTLPNPGTSSASTPEIDNLLSSGPTVLNVGVRTFAGTLEQAGVPHLHVEWQPPAGGDPGLGRLIAILGDESTPDSAGALVKAANEQALERILTADPVWEDVRPAREIWPEMDDRLLFHSGPPIEWERMCGPMQGAVIGAILLEGWAGDEAEARRLAESGGVRFAPCHHYGAVGPMAGLVTPSMPMFVVRNAEAGNLSYSSLNEGMGKVLRYGAYAPEVLARLRWMCDVLGPTLKIGIQAMGGLHLMPLMAQALQMGDELHNRHIAATSLLFKTIAPPLIRALEDRERVASALDPIAANNYFFLNLAMAACKASMDAGHNIPNSSVVTVMARNGTDFGIRVSGCGDRWFTAPVETPKGVYLPGFTQDDAAGDIGDSAITETAGLGGFAMGGAPAVVKVVGGTPADALAFTESMYTITLSRNPHWTLPPLGFAGTATGIDVRKVVDTGVRPIINTGIAHREAGIGQVGAGLVNPPMACFTEALQALAEAVRRD